MVSLSLLNRCVCL